MTARRRAATTRARRRRRSGWSVSTPVTTRLSTRRSPRHSSVTSMMSDSGSETGAASSAHMRPAPVRYGQLDRAQCPDQHIYSSSGTLFECLRGSGRRGQYLRQAVRFWEQDGSDHGRAGAPRRGDRGSMKLRDQPRRLPLDHPLASALCCGPGRRSIRIAHWLRSRL